MLAQFTKQLLILSAISFVLPQSLAMAKSIETLKGEQITKNISIIKAGPFRFHTFEGISNSHIIETKNELRMIDAQFNFKHARQLKKYIEGLGKPLVQVILSHNHPDHWFGAEVFAAKTPIATSKNIMADLKSGGMRYIKIMEKNPKMKGIMPSKVIVPSVETKLGEQNWDGLKVIVEEYADQEAHNSILIKVPAYGIMIGQDLFYNNKFLVASERGRNKNWRNILAGFLTRDSKHYKTLLVGHGKNGGPSILAQDIAYLDALEATLAKGLSKEETTKEMIAAFPEMSGKGLLGISMRNLFHGH